MGGGDYLVRVELSVGRGCVWGKWAQEEGADNEWGKWRRAWSTRAEAMEEGMSGGSGISAGKGERSSAEDKRHG